MLKLITKLVKLRTIFGSTQENTPTAIVTPNPEQRYRVCVSREGRAAISHASVSFNDTLLVFAGHSPPRPFVSFGLVVIARHHNIVQSRVSAASPLPLEELVPGRRGCKGPPHLTLRVLLNIIILRHRVTLLRQVYA